MGNLEKRLERLEQNAATCPPLSGGDDAALSAAEQYLRILNAGSNHYKAGAAQHPLCSPEEAYRMMRGERTERHTQRQL